MAGQVRVEAWEPVRTSAAYWSRFARMTDIWWTRSAGRAAIEAVAAARFAALVRHARERSRFYRDLYRALPEGEVPPAALPVATRGALMARFDDWVTDPAVTLAGLRAFLADRTRIGERYLGRYVVWKSSGSTGEPGIYVQDDDALATCDALLGAGIERRGAAGRVALPLPAGSTRAALVAATGDHYASIASWRRACRDRPWLEARGFSILDPLPQLVARLNDYRPGFLASYPTMLVLLAAERRAGRLTIAPLCLWSGGECLGAPARRDIETAFGCPVVDEYGASECLSIAVGCREGSLHVNADWVRLEAVDEDHRPCPPGVPSATALLTNLANRVQPIIRYDLGDSILVVPEPCACGSPLPVIRVEGRQDDVLAMAAPDGRCVRLPPLALTTVVEEAAPLRRFQIVQAAPDRLLLRLDPRGVADPKAAARAAVAALSGYLARQGLPDVRIGWDRHDPVADRRSGKLRAVVAARSTEAWCAPPAVATRPRRAAASHPPHRTP